MGKCSESYMAPGHLSIHCTLSLLAFHARVAHRRCTLDPDSLDPLAEVASLRELHLEHCDGVTLASLQQLYSASGFIAASLERLLSTSVQGCCLRISLTGSGVAMTQEACCDLRSRVLAQRGSRDTPALLYV
jgi:hypothetical protein